MDKLEETSLVERLRELLAAATETPWHLGEAFGKPKTPTVYATDEDLRYIARFQDGPCFHSATPDLANARLVSEAITALPTLLDALEAYRKRETVLVEALAEAMVICAKWSGPDGLDHLRTALSQTQEGRS